MSRPAAADPSRTPAVAGAGADRLLACSPDRTLFVTNAPGGRVVCKLFVRGALADAEREVRLGRELASLGVARYREAHVDPVTNRPAVILDWHEGADLDLTVSHAGAIPGARAASLLAPVARTLAAMHALHTPNAPAGICHGDVKPANLLVTDSTSLVLDLEHTRAIATGNGLAEVTGTVGFAAPEARAGAPASAALDVYGLGATLRWLLTGGGLARLPQDDELLALVRQCTAADPTRRPAMADVATALAGLAHRLADDSDERILARLAAGERIEFVGATPRHAPLQRLALRQRRLLARFPELLTPPPAPPSTPAELLRALHHCQRVLRHFPCHRASLTWRRRLCDAARDLLGATASRVSELQRQELHDEAARWLDDAVRLARALLLLPGRQPIPGAPDPRSAGLLQRDPIAFLERLAAQLAEARAELASAVAAIDSAEQQLDLAAAESAIDAMAARYGGSSPTAARRRDQLHRLRFCLDRIASALPNVERLGRTWDRNALEPLVGFVAGCARAIDPAATETASPLGLRSLQVTLVNLAEEFPHLYVRSGPALEALAGALEHISELAAALVEQARGQLASVPVPVRPLQITLGRLDSFRILEALVDRPDRPRSELLDAIESLRLKFEQARAARDRLAEGAEEAIARGHWTTGLFDMERAVASLSGAGDDDGGESHRLENRLDEARRKKRELEDNVRRNVELGNRYGTLQDDPDSTFEARLETLDERRGCLRFLADNLPAERAQLYARDLREVEVFVALERAGIAEAEFDRRRDDLPARHRLAAETLERLESSLGTAEFAGEPPGRLVRVLEHWRTLQEQCATDLEREAGERRQQRRTRRRLLAAAALSLGVTLSAVGWAAGPWLYRNVFADARPPRSP
ncbi:MAG: hypothetical protein KDE27_10475, partial [Planctomycetes bacterium]|nr:hypothetical protein [Planctomycetota bacterium]